MTGVVQFLATRNGLLTLLSIVSSCIVFGLALMIETTFRANEIQIHQAAERVATYRSIAATIPQLASELRVSLQQSAKMPTLIAADNANLAEAQLQMHMKAIVQVVGGQIQSARMLPSSAVKDMEAVAIQYELTVPADHLQSLIYATESHVPYLYLDDVSIRSSGAPSANLSKSRPETLAVECTVHAYRWVKLK